MAIYLKKFKNHTQYENYINGSGAILPNVSICKTEGDAHYNPWVDPYGGHDYVEIAGLKWATMNVGANSITDTGLYFQWGDISGYTSCLPKGFGWSDYKYNSGGTSPSADDMTKYNEADGKTVLDASDDAVIANWGGKWRMPTIAEYDALGWAVNTAWTADYQGSGVAGMICTDKNDSSKVLFFPAGGYCSHSKMWNVGSNGEYWSSSHFMDITQSSWFMNACHLGFGSQYPSWGSSDGRYEGYLVRGVADE